ncbi:MAG: hypothetical protein ACC653_06505 [Gammaproteobacteria bacterium]
MSIHKHKLCPFSKPIISMWCECPYASLMEGCTGKMTCNREAKFHISCYKLVSTLKEFSGFILGFKPHEVELTHAQSMKIRCGGIIGMQRVLNVNVDSTPVIPDVLDASSNQYQTVTDFPFNEIVQDIKTFSHRKKRH